MALTPKQIDLLNLYEQEWMLHGNIPTADRCEGFGFTKQLISKAHADAEFRTALIARGIRLAGVTDEHTGILTEDQLICANTLLDVSDNRSRKKKLQELGIPTQKYEAWLRDPAYQQYVRQRGENVLGDNSHEAHLALVDRVRAGDVTAIKYYNEITGRYVSGLKDSVDANGIVMRVLEIIQRRVTDPSLQAAIADDLVALAKGSDTSNALNPGTVGFGGALPPRYTITKVS